MESMSRSMKSSVAAGPLGQFLETSGVWCPFRPIASRALVCRSATSTRVGYAPVGRFERKFV